MSFGIARFLPNNEYLAAVNANLPSLANPYATIADLAGFVSGNIYTTDGIITEERTVSGGIGIAINSIHWNLWDTYNILPADSFNVKNPAEEKIFGIDIGAKSISVKGDLTISESAVASQILNFQDEVNARTGTLTNAPLLTAARTWTLQDGSGTLAFLTDIPAPDGNGIYGGSGTTPSNTIVTVTNSLQFITAGVNDRVQIGPVGFTGLNNFHHRSSNGNGAHFDGNSQSASAYAVKIRDFDGVSTYTTTSQFRNSGRVDLAMTGGFTYMGAQGTNYALQSTNIFKQESTTATYTGFIANRVTAGGGGQIAMRAVSADYTNIVSTGNLVIGAGWNGNFNSGGTPLNLLVNAGNGGVFVNPVSASSLPSGKFEVRGADNSNLTRMLTFTMSNQQAKFIMQNDGSTANGIGFAASPNVNIGHNSIVGGKATAYNYVITGATSKAWSLQAFGNTPTAMFVSLASNSVGINTGIISDVKPTAGTTNIGVSGFAWNGSQYSIGIDGAVGTSGIASSFYIAAVRGGAASALDNLQYGGYFTAQWSNVLLGFTKNAVGVRGFASTQAGDVATSSGTGIGGQFLTTGAAGSGLNMAINVPLTGNNGNVVFGADASSANKTMVEVTGDVEIIGAGGGNGVILESPDGTRWRAVMTDLGAWNIAAA